MFSVHTTPEEFENATINGHFGFGNHMIIVRSLFLKSSFSNCFLSTRNALASLRTYPKYWTGTSLILRPMPRNLFKCIIIRLFVMIFPGLSLHCTLVPVQYRLAYGGCARITSGSENLAVLPKRHDNSVFLHMQLTKNKDNSRLLLATSSNQPENSWFNLTRNSMFCSNCPE